MVTKHRPFQSIRFKNFENKTRNSQIQNIQNRDSETLSNKKNGKERDNQRIKLLNKRVNNSSSSNYLYIFGKENEKERKKNLKQTEREADNKIER